MKTMRLNKFLAQSSVSSRRGADRLIEEGLVRVNGKTITTLGFKVDPLNDQIFCQKKRIILEKELFYFAFYKPKKVLSTLSDPEERPTVSDYIKKATVRLFPVGRLDWDSEGLLLLTNDGDFSQKVIHPKHKISKTYYVKIKGRIYQDSLDKLETGITLSGKKAYALEARRIKSQDNTKNDWIKVVIQEGRNQQIRRMLEKINFHVTKLKRVAIGKLKLGKLKPGEIQALSKNDTLKIFTHELSKKEFKMSKKELLRLAPKPDLD